MTGVSPAEVVAVTGASEALWLLLLVAAEPGANVVLPHPGYPAFDELARHARARGSPLPPRRSGTKRHRSRRGGRADRPPDRELLLVNTPHNPTGAVVSDALLQQLSDLAVEQRTRLVVDEVYHPIYHGPASSSVARLPDATTMGDLSKALCLSGLRIGWIIDHDAARLAQYEDARSYLTISNSPINEALAAAAIRSRDTIISRAQAVAEQNLATLDTFVGEHVERLGWVRPTGGLTAFPWLRSRRRLASLLHRRRSRRCARRARRPLRRAVTLPDRLRGCRARVRRGARPPRRSAGQARVIVR